MPVVIIVTTKMRVYRQSDFPLAFSSAMLYNIRIASINDPPTYRRNGISMKKLIITALLLAGISSLCACSGSSEPTAAVESTDNGSTATAAGISISFPQDWSCSAGDEIYKQLAALSATNEETASEMKQDYADIGMTYLVYAESPDKSAIVFLSSQEISAAQNTGERLSVTDYARTNHDTSVISFQASGMLINDSSMSEQTIGGKTGWLSHYEVSSEEEPDTLLLGQSEFTFEYSDSFYSLQCYYYSHDSAQLIEDILGGITAAQ